MSDSREKQHDATVPAQVSPRSASEVRLAKIRAVFERTWGLYTAQFDAETLAQIHLKISVPLDDPSFAIRAIRFCVEPTMVRTANDLKKGAILKSPLLEVVLAFCGIDASVQSDRPLHELIEAQRKDFAAPDPKAPTVTPPAARQDVVWGRPDESPALPREDKVVSKAPGTNAQSPTPTLKAPTIH